jgi:hypothetical protein
MNNNQLTNEQKLDEVYTILRAMERRRMMDSLGRILKWVIILGIAGFVLSNPRLIVERITEYVKPIVMEQVETMTKELNDKLMQSAKDMLPSR